MALISSVTAPSLLAQRDQGFCWAILVDGGLPIDIRRDLEAVLEPFDGRAFLHQSKARMQEGLVEVARERDLSEGSPYLLTARIDDDDAWSTGMVGAVRQRVASWLDQQDRARGLSLTFQDGLEWIMYEMLDVEKLSESGERRVHAPAIRRYRAPFIGMSIFVCSLLSDGMTAMAGPHSRVAENLSETMGFATDVVSTDSPMWLYCRHKQAGSGVRKASEAEVHLTLAELAAQFGLDEKGVKSYLDQAEEHEYALVRPLVGPKHKLLAELLRVNQDIEDPSTTAAKLSQLHARRKEIAAELERLEVDLLGDPEAL